MIEKIKEFFRLVEGLNVLVIGETIVDEFVPVSYEGNSMKSNCPVLKYEGKAMLQEGGASAIYNHLKDFVSNVDLLSNPKGTIVKTRFYDPFDNRKHVEINKFDKENYGTIPAIGKNYDLIIVADFGHGYCNNLQIDQPFCLMTQTNSNNFGFNRVSKWKNQRKLMTCLDLREASLQMNKHYFSADETMIKEIYNYELNSQYLFVTTGKTGSVFTDGEHVFQQPVYKTDIVDTIGAGDTFFTFASLISSLPDKLEYLFLPGLAASLSTTWLCNEYSVNKNNLISHASKFVS
jgi:bifunctional ADP-heptose synthase (sugar kinase/adenylyltransferase)